ncbi:MAG: ECF transporter S component [Clostridiales bacterium]|nr:ECF transporter S component [Clostridiales bacterium]
MSNANVNPKVGRLARMALLVAIIILLTFTPLGYITLPFIAATTIQMPVIIGAMMMGPMAGLALGIAFGLSALCKVLMMPGADPVATAILSYNFFLYAVIAIVPRGLMGWLSGLLFAGLNKTLPNQRLISYGITGFVGSMLNTIFYLGSLWLMASGIVAEVYSMDISGVGAMVMTVAATAGIPEAIVSCMIVAAVCRALQAIDKNK